MGGRAFTQRILSSSRYLVIVAIIGTLVGSVTLLLYGVIEIGAIVVATARSGTVSSAGAQALALGFIATTISGRSGSPGNSAGEEGCSEHSVASTRDDVDGA